MERCWNLVLGAEETHFLIVASGAQSNFSPLPVRRASDPSPGCSSTKVSADRTGAETGQEEGAEQPQQQQDTAHAVPIPLPSPAPAWG